jgi:hypothetical protein
MALMETTGIPAPGTVITANRIRMIDDPALVGSIRPIFPRVEPDVRLIREDGVIRAFEVVCGCGEKVRVKCDYS